jgi:VWFA-related protein
MLSSLPIIKTARLVALPSVGLALLAYLLIGWPRTHAQTPQDPPPPPPVQTTQDQGEVVRTYTELIQTDVMVFDKQGKFASGLTSSDFELRIDGKVKPVDFFERVTAGSTDEELQLAAARGTSRPGADRLPAPAPLDRGRPIFFFVDDLHMDLTAIQTARKLITKFLDNEMRQNDEVAIASSSGQIGFLQQLTDNKTVLRAALERLRVRTNTVKDFERPTMTEYQALMITNYDHDATEFFIDATMREIPGLGRDAAESLVRARASSTAKQSNAITTNSLAGLEGLVRGAEKLPGRKLVFFISGGFFIEDHLSDTRDRLQRITSAAARSSVVIYSMDARGLIGNFPDASSDMPFDPSGRLQRVNGGEIIASQNGMNALARDTGGKPFFNSNSLDPALGKALRETATYYLLAWKPDPETRGSGRFRRIEVKVIGRPELTVQVRRGFFDREPDAAKTAKNEKRDKKKTPDDKTPEAQVRKIMLTSYPVHDLPVSLSLSYLKTQTKGPRLSAALEVPHEFLSFVPVNGKAVATVTLVGTVFDEKGNEGGSFHTRVTVEAPTAEEAKSSPDLTYGYPIYVPAGLYQVRVGVRDEASGRAGTAHSWIEIPNITSGQLALSSVLTGLRTQATLSNASAPAPGTQETVNLSITNRFAPNGYLRFLVMIYNAMRAPADAIPDVALQVQVLRDDQPVTTTPLRKVSTDEITDLTSIPYAAELPLNRLPAGRYTLKVMVVDRVAKKSASQQTRFEIE